MDAALLEMLRCPDDRAELVYDESAQTLTCTGCRLIFEVRDGIPVLLIGEVTPLLEDYDEEEYDEEDDVEESDVEEDEEDDSSATAGKAVVAAEDGE